MDSKSCRRDSGVIQLWGMMGIVAVVMVCLLLLTTTKSLQNKIEQQATLDAAVLGAAATQAAVLDMNAVINNVVVISHIIELTTAMGGFISSAVMCVYIVSCPQGIQVASKTVDIVNELVVQGRKLADVRDTFNEKVAPAMILLPFAQAGKELGKPIVPFPIRPGETDEQAPTKGGCLQTAALSIDEIAPPQDRSDPKPGWGVQVQKADPNNGYLVRAMMNFPELLFGKKSKTPDDRFLKTFMKTEQELLSLLDQTPKFVAAQIVGDQGNRRGLRNLSDRMPTQWRTKLDAWIQNYDQLRQRAEATTLPDGSAVANQMLLLVRSEIKSVADQMSVGEAMDHDELKQLLGAIVSGSTSTQLSAAMHQVRKKAVASEGEDPSMVEQMLKWTLVATLCGGAKALEKISDGEGLAQPTILPVDFHERQFLLGTTFQPDTIFGAAAQAQPDNPRVDPGEPILWPGFQAELMPLDPQHQYNWPKPLASLMEDLVHY